MSEPQLKIRIRLDQSTDRPEIGQHLPEQPEESLSPLPPEYEYNWPRIAIAGAVLLFVLIVIVWIISDTSSDEAELETNPAEITLPAASAKSTQPAESAEYLSGQLPENNSGDSNPPGKDTDSNHVAEVPDLPSKKQISQVTSSSPVKPGIKPDFILPQSKPGSNSQKTSRSPGLVKAQLTSNIRQRQPVDNIDQVSLNGKSSRPVFLFLHLSQFKGKKIFINWYYQNQSIAKISLLVGNNDWRTYSSKVLNQNRLGPWRVTASDQTGKLLAEFKFNVTR
ncbi:DUF2914 domain-containing protein [Nitrosomonas sp.]|uniref:DUF2914 domain-containing protein n=1 Tax=Nitrosomonas sp. TaxID=42353 RepID=UPI0025E2CA24|nr:DUF2914 domain-containing protein [Nitrosomonas sp.]MCC6915742.1 DUF2914 domain-containing protein [Nitrosomonas sp.]